MMDLFTNKRIEKILSTFDWKKINGQSIGKIARKNGIL